MTSGSATTRATKALRSRSGAARSGLRRAGLAAALLAGCLATPALAAEPTGNPLADAFLAGLEARGLTDVTVTTVTGDNDTVDISGLKAVQPAGKPEAATGAVPGAGGAVPAPDDAAGPTAMSVDHITIDKATLDQGRIRAGVFNASGLTFSEAKSKVTINQIAATDVDIPPPRPVRTVDDMAAAQAIYKDVAITGLTLTDDTGFTVPVAAIDIQSDGAPAGQSKMSGFSVRGIHIDVSRLPEDGLRRELLALGYNALDINVTAKGTWEPDSSTGNIDEVKIGIDGVGALTLTGKIAGLTPAAIAILSDPTRSRDSDEIFQTLMVKDATLTFTNETLVQRLLAAQAKDAGTTADVYASQLSAALPMLLMPLKDVEFQKAVADAGAAFLKDPRALRITAAPRRAVPITELIGTVLVAPQTLPGLLKVQVAANP